MNVNELIEANPPLCLESEPLQQVAERMCLHERDSLPVCDAQRRLIGRITTRAICQMVCAMGNSLSELLVGDALCGKGLFGRSNEPADVLLRRMVRDRVWQLPIVDQAGVLVGTISYDRLLKEISGARDLLVIVHTVDQLDGFATCYEHVPRWTLVIKQRELVSPDGASNQLSRGETRLLLALAKRAGSVLGRDELMQHIVNRSWDPSDRYVDVLVASLRRRFGERGTASRIIRTVLNEGYVLTLRVANERQPAPIQAVRSRANGTPSQVPPRWAMLAGS
jgi:DNA-binding winged helix-turn-helix (wHTH) protein/predicted transcriptional regulator